MRTFLLALSLVMLGAGAVAQKAEEKPPSLSDVQKLQVQNALQRLEIAQLRLQAAQQDANTVLKSLTIPGWKLDLSTLTYTKEKERHDGPPPQ